MLVPAINPTHGSGLDHVGFIVADLEASSRLVSELGFRQTARADHTRTNSAGVLVSAGSSQHSVMLQRGYIELMQITDPLAGHQLTPATAVRHGLHVIAFGTDDAAACRQACIARGVEVGPLLNWARLIREDDVLGEARFCYFDSRWDPHDPSYVCWVQHLTPQLLRPPRLLQHDNGVLALTGVVYRGPRRLAEPWVAQLQRAGASSSVQRAGGATVQLHDARVEIDFDDTAVSVLPAALLLAGADLPLLRRRCDGLGIRAGFRSDGALDIDLDRYFGLHWICTTGADHGTA